MTYPVSSSLSDRTPADTGPLAVALCLLIVVLDISCRGIKNAKAVVIGTWRNDAEAVATVG